MIDFNALIEKYVYREFRAKQIGRYYPSEVGSCLRKLWYTYKNPKEIDTEKRKIFEAGNIMHEFVTKVLKSGKSPGIKLIKTEMPVKTRFEDFIVSGRIDDVVLVESEGKLYIVEIKSVSYMKYIKKPQPHHMMQLQYYMYASGVHNGLILYVEKNTLKSKTFNVKYNEKVVDLAIKRFETLHESLKENKIPPPEGSKSKEKKWMCDYCEYREECLG